MNFIAQFIHDGLQGMAACLAADASSSSEATAGAATTTTTTRTASDDVGDLYLCPECCTCNDPAYVVTTAASCDPMYSESDSIHDSEPADSIPDSDHESCAWCYETLTESDLSVILPNQTTSPGSGMTIAIVGNDRHSLVDELLLHLIRMRETPTRGIVVSDVNEPEKRYSPFNVELWSVDRAASTSEGLVSLKNRKSEEGHTWVAVENCDVIPRSVMNVLGDVSQWNRHLDMDLLVQTQSISSISRRMRATLDLVFVGRRRAQSRRELHDLFQQSASGSVPSEKAMEELIEGLGTRDFWVIDVVRNRTYVYTLP